ncbi:MAG TPA: S8 family serine peptidase [Herpetosiphonaceae bacterium]|nr:S8 family serine peptidase [Herpetosiphonaceae bacterium]
MRNNRVLIMRALLVALFAGGAGTQAAPSAQAVVDPQLQAALANATGPVEVIVAFRSDGAPSAADVDLLRQVGITTGVTLRSLPMAGVLATADQVNALAAQPAVRSLYFNQELAYENAEATALTGVDKVRTDAGMTKKNGGLPVSGTGVTVLVNDSGVDGTHQDLEFGPHLVQNVEAAANLNAIDQTLLPITYVEDVPNTDSTGGHGTHVAGIVGGTGARSNGKYEGVAPGADLVGYGSGAGLFLLDVLSGFDYGITHQAEYGIRVITNSWGTTSDKGTDVDPNDPINIATKRAYDRGIVVVFSAGNSGPNAGTITGNYKKAPWVITVAAGDKQRALAGFSSRGIEGKEGTFEIDGETWTWQDRPTVTSPGVKIVSTRTASPVGVIATDDDVALIEPAYLPYYTTLNGTSMAAPHVAGIVALMLDANPQLAPLEIKQILQETATDMAAYATWEVGDGYVDAYAAVDRAFQATSKKAGASGQVNTAGTEMIGAVGTPGGFSWWHLTAAAGLGLLSGLGKQRGVHYCRGYLQRRRSRRESSSTAEQRNRP